MEGGHAVRNHTGGLAMTDSEAVSFMQKCGIIRVKSLRQLMLAAKGFGFFPQGIGNRILLFSNSGGPGVITTDHLIDNNLKISIKSKILKDISKKRIIIFTSKKNKKSENLIKLGYKICQSC